ncbi:hypothetical protein NEAUS04_1674 [Nematocida ausubeli]|uniref:GRAM domain-containing protein n=1 Tax=Nematocida ausubeli (strain ATCC PRA-371 / ERTm2) TaxID=1913371 RepID=H8ZFH5_NEMA1|nr:uncharacterized protein NESG_00402 [Nematocida ausubeli]EHY64536.1 hypothetical protein NERG_02346 [Nematocida ausubeli]KAI5137422.1 hypothetical protein NEAUS07_1961 [Nematocida ausubeli]KAI5149962.1 hypothetical protein NEAUS05_1976 [Nematocida ausubeli]KAI5163574.1 hypothetical protein NEAUS04_1674 [Nematocida ausubeli]KFG27324.1 hypothetical protein NESG_00402 [Nematocida ausubeli]
MLRDTYRNFNTCLFTKAGTPLPLDDHEVLLYAAEDVGYSIVVGEGGLFNTYRHKSNHGSLFVTNCRLIYLPKMPTTLFCSFFCMTTGIMNVSMKGSKKVCLEVSLFGNVASKISLKMRDNLPDTLVQQIKVSQAYLSRIE